MEKEEQEPSLVEVVTRRSEAERVLAVAEEIYTHERQLRCFALMLAGLSFKLDDEAMSKDLLAASHAASEAASQREIQRNALMAHLKATASVLPESTSRH